MKKTLYPVLVSVILFSLNGCKKTNTTLPGGGTPAKDIYVAGFEESSTGILVPKYWKNGTVVTLSHGIYDAGASSIFVSGNDVYVAGSEITSIQTVFPFSTTSTAKYWKNGTAVNLSSGTDDAYGNSVFVSGNDIYEAGAEQTSTRPKYPFINSVAKYWKNGTPVGLTDGRNYAVANSIFVLGNDVYVAGFEFKDTLSVAKYWKNGVPVNLTYSTNEAAAYSIFVSGSNVYVSGGVYTGSSEASSPELAIYWKNGIATTFPNGADNSYAGSIFVSGNDVYVSGAKYTNTAVPVLRALYWKNGTEVDLTDGAVKSSGGSIFVIGTDVYSAGSIGDGSTGIKAVYWKNGTAVNLTDGINYAVANSIFVTQ